MRSGLILWFASACVLIACRAEEPPPKPTTDPSADLQVILFGSDTRCNDHSTCASRVCYLSRCAGLADASQTWMEAQIARALLDLTHRHPATIDLLFSKYLKHFDEEPPYARVRFVGALGRLGHPRATPWLESLISSPIETLRVRATLALGRMGQPKHFTALQALTTHRSEAVKMAAAEALGTYLSVPANTQAAQDTLLQLLGAPSHRIRRRVIHVLGDSGANSQEIIGALEKILHADGDGYLSYDATQALEKLQAKD